MGLIFIMRIKLSSWSCYSLLIDADPRDIPVTCYDETGCLQGHDGSLIGKRLFSNFGSTSWPFKTVLTRLDTS